MTNTPKTKKTPKTKNAPTTQGDTAAQVNTDHHVQLPPPPQNLNQPPLQQPAYQLNEERLANLFAAAVNAGFAAQQQRLNNQAQNPPPTTAPTQKRITGMTLTNLCSWCGLDHLSPLPPIWYILPTVDTNGARREIINRFLLAEQETNHHITYTLRAEAVRDIAKVDFYYEPFPEFLARGITPFTIQKLDNAQISSIRDNEEALERATYVKVEDITKLDKKTVRPPPNDPNTFLEILATYQALLKTLLGMASPIYHDIKALYQYAREIHQEGWLKVRQTEQPEWFAHVLWATTVASKAFFKKALQLDDLQRGEQLQRPLSDILRNIKGMAMYKSTGLPDELRVKHHPLNPHQKRTPEEPELPPAKRQ